MEALGISVLASLGFSGSGMLPSQFSDSELDAALADLSVAPRGREVVRLILRGYGDKQIAAKMGIKFSTERTYLSRTFARVDVSGRMELVTVVIDRMLSNRKAENK